MNVAVPYKRGQQRLRSSLLGDGLLERARSTSLALLGLTAAVGLAMVAMALNQGWPLIAGAPIPGFGDKHQAVGEAAVAAKPGAPTVQASGPQSGDARRQAVSVTPPATKGAGKTPVSSDSQPPASESIVVSNSTPASPEPVGGSPGDGSPAPKPASQQQAVTPVPPPSPAPAASPPAQAPVASVSTPPPASSAGAPPPETSEEVDEDDADDDDDCPPEDEEWDSDDDHSHGWHHGYGHSRR